MTHFNLFSTNTSQVDLTRDLQCFTVTKYFRIISPFCYWYLHITKKNFFLNNSFFKSVEGMCTVCIMGVANYLEALENLFRVFLILRNNIFFEFWRRNMVDHRINAFQMQCIVNLLWVCYFACIRYDFDLSVSTSIFFIKP